MKLAAKLLTILTVTPEKFVYQKTQIQKITWNEKCKLLFVNFINNFIFKIVNSEKSGAYFFEAANSCDDRKCFSKFDREHRETDINSRIDIGY